MAALAATNALTTRDAKGRFLPGFSGGPGRPPKAVEERYALAVKKAVSPADVMSVLRHALAAAKKGDVPAMRLILAYAVGVPVETTLEVRITSLEAIASEINAHKRSGNAAEGA